MTPIRREVIVVGGGQSGLAIGYFLARRGRDFTILEAAGALLGLSWLHTRGSALIGWVKDDAEYLAREISTFHQALSAERRPAEQVA